VLDVWCYVKRSTLRLMSEQGPGGEQARRLVHRIVVLGEEHTEVARSLEASISLTVIEALDRTQTD